MLNADMQAAMKVMNFAKDFRMAQAEGINQAV
jgi:hypothetical protein